MAEETAKRVLAQMTEQGVTALLAELVKRSSVVGTPSQCPQFVAGRLRQDLCADCT